MTQWSIWSNPWVPVLMVDGSRKELPLKEVFEQAASIRNISPDLPQEEFPILRLLLAIMYRAYCRAVGSNPSNKRLEKIWYQIWENKSFPMNLLDAYAQHVGDGWNLTGSRPFYQVADLQYPSGGKSEDPIADFIPDFPKKHEKFLFSMRSEGSVDSISYAQAARLILFLQAYDISGIHTPARGSKTAKAGKEHPPKGMLGMSLLGALGGVFNQGKNLFETLMLNWVLCHGDQVFLKDQTDDLAPWDPERPAPSTQMNSHRYPKGPVDLLTWQSRRLLLITTDDGTRIKGLRRCFGDIADVTRLNGLEMMTVWRESKTQEKRQNRSEVFMPAQHDPNKYEWQGLASLLAHHRKSLSNGDNIAEPKKEGKVSKPGIISWVSYLQKTWYISLPEVISVRAQGIVYGSQSAVIASGVDDALDLSTVLLKWDDSLIIRIIDTVSKSEDAVSTLTGYVRNLEIAAGNRDPDMHRDAVSSEAYHRLDAIFRERLRTIPSDPSQLDSFLADWRAAVHRSILTQAAEFQPRIEAPLFGGRADTKGTMMTATLANFYLRANLNKTLGTLNSTVPVTVSPVSTGK